MSSTNASQAKPPEPLQSADAKALLARRAHQTLPDAPPVLLHADTGPLTAAPIAQVTALLAAALRWMAAALRPDRWMLPPSALGLPDMVADSRRLLCTAERRNVDLQIISESGGRWLLAGQVRGADETDRTLMVLQPAGGRGAVHHASLDPLGGFRLDGVAPGQWCLSLQTADRTVALPAFDVGGPWPA